MHIPQNKKELISMVEHSNYLPVLGSLLIGFVIAWTLYAPGMTKNNSMEHQAPTQIEIDREEISLDNAAANEAVFVESDDIEQLPTPVLQKQVERNPLLPTPEIFVKATAIDGGYLLHFSTQYFAVGRDGYLTLTQDDTHVTKLFASPYFLPESMLEASTHIGVQLVTNNGDHISVNGKEIKEYIRW